MSFQLEVQFSGLAMYVVDVANGRVGVLMPDCRKQQDPASAFHLDGSPAEPHVGYVRINLANVDNTYPPGTDTPYRKSPEYELIHRFDFQQLEFVGTFGSEPTVFTPLDVPNFDEFAPNLELIPDLFQPDPPVQLLMRTILQGGSLLADATEEDQWRIPRRFIRPPDPFLRQFASAVKWTRIVDSPELTLRITDFTGTHVQASFTLRPVAPSNKVTVKIANLCAHNPVEWSEMHFRKVNGKDVDFKWLYRLLKDPETSYPELLLDDELPVPEYIGPLSSGSDDCMPGKITGTI